MKKHSVNSQWVHSLRGLINVRIILSVVVISLVGGSLAIWQARESVREEVSSSYNLALQMVEFGLKEFSRSEHSETEWLQQISALRVTRHLQISVVNKQGQELNFFQEKEKLKQALPPDWFIDAVMIDNAGAEYEIKFMDSQVYRIIIRADPMDEIIEAWGESQAYFWSIVLMMLVIFLAINVVFNSMLRTVQTILSGLKQVETGDYEVRLPKFDISEFDAIAGEINNLTEALKVAKENNQALARHTMQIQERERSHMSRELHDEMGQSLTAVKAMAVAAKQPTAAVAPIAESIIEICNHLSVVVRSMMRTLHPLSLTDLGLTATLTDLVNEWQRRHPTLKIQLEYDEVLDELDDEVAIHVYRIVQECLTNVVRHANAREAFVSVKQSTIKDESQVMIWVEDDGVGGTPEGDGFGILAMRERVESMGGKFNFASAPGQGARIKAWMPFIEKIR